MTATVRTTCPYCGVGCGILATPDGAGGVAIAGDPDHPANFGRLCSKGSALGQTVVARRPPPRPPHPRTRRRAGTRPSTSSPPSIRATTPERVAIYGSGQLLTEDYYVANKLMKGFIGAANIDTNSRLCMASAVAGHRRAFGTDTVPGTYEDLEEADLVVLVGSNLAWCHPVLYQRLAAAKAARPTMKVVTVDPRRTATTDLADLHLALAPDTDVALFNALLAEIARRGAADAAYLAHVTGFDAAVAAAEATDPAVTGLAPADLAAFLDLWIGTEKVVTVFSQGVNQSASGTDKVNAIINCPPRDGPHRPPRHGPFQRHRPAQRHGRPRGRRPLQHARRPPRPREPDPPLPRQASSGTPPHSPRSRASRPSTSSAPAADGRDRRPLDPRNQPRRLHARGRQPSPRPSRRSRSSSSPTCSPPPTPRAAPTSSSPPSAGARSPAPSPTPSAASPASARSSPRPGEARPDWWALAEVGRRLGHADAFAYEIAAEIFREHAALSALAAAEGRDFDIAALADADYDAMPPAQWPVGGACPLLRRRPLLHSRRPRPDGRRHPGPGREAARRATRSPSTPAASATSGTR